MRRRELVKRLRSDLREFRLASSSGFLSTSRKQAQAQSMRRLELLHALENLVPEIIEKLEQES
jgi:hypothetical protein